MNANRDPEWVVLTEEARTARSAREQPNPSVGNNDANTADVAESTTADERMVKTVIMVPSHSR